ncbi:hypothetical protein PTKU15_83450 [Paraburkholderia terrae]|nr:hypothetical protein PTKU15_83450 [Paraburkholderia terrae]
MSLQKHDFAHSDMKRRAGLLHGVVLDHGGRLRMVNCGPGQRGWGRYMLRIADAMELYEQAIRSAQDSGFVHGSALGNELASRFYAAQRF